MNIVEYAEMICGGELPLWQRKLLEKYQELPPGSKLVYCNRRFHVIRDDDAKTENSPIIDYERCLGLHAKMAYIDEQDDYILDPTIVFEKDGGIRIPEVSLVRNPSKTE